MVSLYRAEVRSGGERSGPGLLLAAVLTLASSACSPGPGFDLIILGGSVLDGTGSAPRRADVGISGMSIAGLGDLSGAKAAAVLRADGLIVSPGFIDLHTHCDRDIAARPGADNYVSQGVTTVIGGNCGGHVFPVRELARRVRRTGIGVNLGLLAGHNTLRQEVMGLAMRPPTAVEMERMKTLLEGEMRAGAFGLSTGLSYLPGAYAGTSEVVELAAVAARFGGFYATHLRDQGRGVREAIEEAVRVGLQAGMPVQISHVKLADEEVWNRLDLVREPVEAARRAGLDITLDIYPYAASSSGFSSSFPAWAFEGGRKKFLDRLDDRVLRLRIRDHIIKRRLVSPSGREMLGEILISRCSAFPEFEGMTLEEVLSGRGVPRTPQAGAEIIIEIERNGGATGVFFQMDEADVASLMRLEGVMIASDGAIEAPGRGRPHPRSYGAFTRVLGRYVREDRVLTLEEAVRKMTSLPARRLGLMDRGVVRIGAKADLAVFDPDKVLDRATYATPHRHSLGMKAVLVNGQVVWESGRPTGRRPGRFLAGPGAGAKRVSASPRPGRGV